MGCKHLEVQKAAVAHMIYVVKPIVAALPENLILLRP
jgi:hypothetical protein